MDFKSLKDIKLVMLVMHLEDKYATYTWNQLYDFIYSEPKHVMKSSDFILKEKQTF